MFSKKRGQFLVLGAKFKVLLILSLFIILASFSSAAGESGCYTYPKASEDIYCVNSLSQEAAAADCALNSGCNLNTYFHPDISCSKYPECDLITCSLTCQEQTKGKCEQQGGTIVTPEQYPSLCTPGCCVLQLPSGDKQCDYPLYEVQCKDLAAKKGASSSFYNYPGITPASCKTEICQQTLLKGSLQGTVKDGSGSPISGAKLTIPSKSKEISSSSDGLYQIQELDPGTYLIEISHQNYQAKSVSVVIGKGEKKVYDFVLSKGASEASVIGTVSSQGLPLSYTTIIWKGSSAGTAKSDAQGKFSLSLSPGKYTFSFAKSGYKGKSQSVTLASGENKLNIILEESMVTSLEGFTLVDIEGDLKGEPKYGVAIFIDGVFAGTSAYPDGRYHLDLEGFDKGTYLLSAVYQGDYNFGPQSVTLKPQEQKSLNLLLTKKLGQCSSSGPDPQKSIASFTLASVPGSKAVSLQWAKPCPEVSGYLIERSLKSNPSQKKFFQFSGLDKYFVDSSPELVWGQTYIYNIKAVYLDGSQPRYSKEPTVREITLGDPLCEGRFSLGKSSSFCLPEKSSSLFSCDYNNQLKEQKCSTNYFCSPSSTTKGIAVCKEASLCANGGGIFGLQFSRSLCYGTSQPEKGAPNFCYYDYSNTIADQCLDCREVKSCFDYRSKDSCEVNNCLSSQCRWVDGGANSLKDGTTVDNKVDDEADNNKDGPALVDYSSLFSSYNQNSLLISPETGVGYCTEKDYKKDDQCSSCGPNSLLFENYYCTAQVCSALGRCFSNPSYFTGGLLASCNSCGNTPSSSSNCYTYTTEYECTNGQPVQSNDLGFLTPSEDSCGWNICRWEGSKDGPGSCVKDGDADSKDDCSGFNGGESKSCRIDHQAPETYLKEENKIISLADSEMIFIGDDTFNSGSGQSNPLGVLGFCLTESSVTGSNIPDSCTKSQFQEISYPGSAPKEEIIINILQDFQKKVQSKPYLLKYYSTDRYHNRGEIQQVLVLIDNVPPQFTVQEDAETLGDSTSLKIYLSDLSEPVSCQLDLQQILPLGEKISKSFSFSDEKGLSLSGLKGVRYDLTANCTDYAGNQNIMTKNYVFDLEEKIELVSPSLHGVLSVAETSFEVKTTVPSSCSLYYTNTGEKIASFSPDPEFKQHKTKVLGGLVEGSYSATYQVTCEDINTHEQFFDYFDFAVDFTPPETQIILTEGLRKEKPVGFGWAEYFVDYAEVSFECLSEGFECDKIFYCLGEGCEYRSNPKYKVYSLPFKLNSSAKICYSASDKSGNQALQPLCGFLHVEGYGLQLESPQGYYLGSDLWGTSNKPEFPLVFSTRVPTSSCKFGISPNFDYDNVEPVRIFQKDNGKYKLEKFPGTILSAYPENGGTKKIYVQCDNGEGKIRESALNLEYDPTAPKIISQKADPSLVVEGSKVLLLVETDDFTVCRYSDDSEGKGAKEYSLMEFPLQESGLSDPELYDEQEQIYLRSHQGWFSFNFIGIKKDYKISVQCKNPAGDFSEVKQISFSVDYSAAGSITKASPVGAFYQGKEVLLDLETSRTAVCSYLFSAPQPSVFSSSNKNNKTNSSSVSASSVPEKSASENSNSEKSFSSTNGKKHQQKLTSLIDGAYDVPVSCLMGDNKVKALLSFTIDNQPPKINSVEDGNYTCGSNEINFFAYSNELNLSGYNYELYEKKGVLPLSFESLSKNQTKNNSSTKNSSSKITKLNNSSNVSSSSSSTSSSSGSALSNGTITLSGGSVDNAPLKISLSGLKSGYTYYLKVWAKDKAGNVGLPAESNGFVVTPKEYPLCVLSGSSLIEITRNNTCKETVFQLVCKSSTGCKDLKYSLSSSLSTCQPSQPYAGKSLSVSKNTYLCYSFKDNSGNSFSGTELITFLDSDGDGISDTCDLCSSTLSGELVSSDGCASGEVSKKNDKDTDYDLLPDLWEDTYNSPTCLLDSLSDDSDFNGVADGEEDYDLDGRTNYVEYKEGTDPCLAESSQVKEKAKDTKLPPVSAEDGSFSLPLIIFLIGLALILFGTGYLIYYYKYLRPEQQRRNVSSYASAKGSPRASSSASSSSGSSGSALGSFANRLLWWKKQEKRKEGERQRFSLFSQFDQSSKEIPHVEKVLSKGGDHLEKVAEASKRYAENIDKIKPGLRPEEKSVFNRLEKIAGQSQKKEIAQIIHPAEAKDIFSRLQEIARKRKGQK
jgi:hypothetical protein